MTRREQLLWACVLGVVAVVAAVVIAALARPLALEITEVWPW